jgi:uncharacterized DUF497 family protein
MVSVSRACYRESVRGDYNFTRAGIANAAQRGITTLEVWEVLDSDRRLFSRIGKRTMIVLGATNDGRHLLVLVREADHEPDVWDIVATREMTTQEISQFRKVRGGPHA